MTVPQDGGRKMEGGRGGEGREGQGEKTGREREGGRGGYMERQGDNVTEKAMVNINRRHMWRRTKGRVRRR